MNIYMTRAQARRYNRLCNQATDPHTNGQVRQIRRQIEHHVFVVRIMNKRRLADRILLLNIQMVLADLTHRELGMLLRKNPQIPECVPYRDRDEVLALAVAELARRHKERIDSQTAQRYNQITNQ